MDSDEDVYDEFGNLIGDAADSDSSSDTNSGDVNYDVAGYGSEEEMVDENENENENDINTASTTAIVLNEDKKYYPSIYETFGPDVETIIQTHDTQDIDEPIVKPVEQKILKLEETELPSTVYSLDYLVNSMLSLPERIRNISLIGNLHSGKTSFLDMLIWETHSDLKTINFKKLKNFKPLRYTDTHFLEIEKGLSIKSTPVTLLLQDLNKKSLVFNILDSPGHVNFADELAISNASVDGAIIILDCIEGLSIGDKLAIQNCLQYNIPMCLVINKIDRLILELRLPPLDAYFKLRHVIEEFNEFIKNSEFNNKNEILHFSPELNNVLFASSSYQFCFNLRSFAQLYCERFNANDLDIDSFGSRLWGDIYYDDKTNAFSTLQKKNSSLESNHRSFIKFILNPLYKIFSHTLTKEPKELASFLQKHFNLNSLPSFLFKLDSQVLLREICKKIFGSSSGFVDMVEKNCPSPIDIASQKIDRLLFNTKSESLDLIKQHISRCDQNGPLIAHITKLIDSKDSSKFYGVVHVISGTLKLKTTYKILGEAYSPDDDEDMIEQELQKIYISGGRYRIPVTELPAGCIGLITSKDLDTFVTKTATIYESTFDQQLYIFKPLDYIIQPVFKVAIEPQNPSELPKLLEGLRKINKSYCGCEIKVEESGEHVILGSGELYMDCLLHDLRKLYSNIEIKVSDPISRFAESCTDLSMTKISIESTNKLNRVTIIAEPLEEKITRDIEIGKVPTSVSDARKIGKLFRDEYKWDALASRSIWSFGAPENGAANILLDDTLPDEVDKSKLKLLKDSIVQGFQWATREGPLCDEPIRSIKFKILDFQMDSDNLLDSNGGQIIPMIRKACYAAMMISSPRLMEPIYRVDIIVKIVSETYDDTSRGNTVDSREVVNGFNRILEKRRGAILEDASVDGTPFYKMVGFVPVIDSVGLETDIRINTQGQAMCFLTFYKWDYVPGDPLQKDCYLPPLKPVPRNSLSRDFVLKTRKRKGLTGEPSLGKYVDAKLLQTLKENGIIDE
ncbi:hypothetical protein PACTADRAFT_34209 [Pachysolen tannophilus NRRL Y-2460]|uniref:Tr-type G domain-containing protein n=1 Tax=Pachysolen tannophilus NRRL Y-2460 TaxID=669874 RepID=A0A1E4TV38_PACTA|nr:hypothetical protein PACTADRAFT_34209 [Pachysolen tannophilus NRRL Y-2460]